MIPALAAFLAYSFDPDSDLAADALDNAEEQFEDCHETQGVVAGVAIILAEIRDADPDAWALICGLRRPTHVVRCLPGAPVNRDYVPRRDLWEALPR